MELLTLLKANIKHKKGSFISVAVLTLLIVTVASAISGVLQNYRNARDRADEYSDTGSSNVIIARELLTDKLLDSVKNSSLVERTEVLGSIQSVGSVKAPTSSDSNSYFLMKVRGGLRLFNENADGFTDEVTKLKKGEIYIPYGLRSKLSVEVGDEISIPLLDARHLFTLKGFVQEPTMGAMMTGWKQVFISDEDYDEIYAECERVREPDQLPFIDIVRIYKSDSDMTDSRFQRELNLETGIINNAYGSITLQQSVRYTGLFAEIICGVVLGFAAIMFVIVLVVTAHSILTETEIDYVSLGILKSQGFTSARITLLFAARYILAELSGAVVGFILSIPLERLLSNIFMSITGILPDKSFPITQSLLFIAVIIALSAVLIFAATRKVTHISPVRAISGGREEIYFASRLNAPITKKALTPSIALRSFTSAKRRYIGIIFIAALLTFFAVTVNILGSSVKSRSARESMGYVIPDITVNARTIDLMDRIGEVETEIGKYSAIRKKYYSRWSYYSLNGENLMCEIYMYPEYIPGMLKGRPPLYDNEVIITEMVAADLGLKMGDTVTVSGRKRDAQYLITGIYQSATDSGTCFAMSYDGLRKISDTHITYFGMALEDTSQAQTIVDDLNEKYSELLAAEVYDWQSNGFEDDVFDIAVLAIQIMIYAFSGVFALVTVIMVCTKAFTQERTDIGIYKAIGFTVGKLRVQFAVRFFIVSLIGGAIGSVAGSMFSVNVLDLIFSLFGVSKVVPDYTAFTFIGAVAFVSLCVLVFSFIVSGKVKWVEIRELVTE